jgi:hypothetical protein
MAYAVRRHDERPLPEQHLFASCRYSAERLESSDLPADTHGGGLRKVSITWVDLFQISSGSLLRSGPGFLCDPHTGLLAISFRFKLPIN